MAPPMQPGRGCGGRAPARDAPTGLTPFAVVGADELEVVFDSLAGLVDEALVANLELRASSLTVQQRLAALAQAPARYLPAIDFAARHTVADGGRTIDIPVGDLVNPIYETLEGWQGTTRGARSWNDLPAQAVKYVRHVEELIGAPVAMLSTSPEREDTILVTDPFQD